MAIYGNPGPSAVLDAFDRGFAYMAACSLAAALTMLALALRSRFAVTAMRAAPDRARS